MKNTAFKIIDPHLHLFNLQDGDYQWLKPQNPPFWPDKHLINQTFNEADLRLNSPMQLAGFVHIEAGFDNNQPWREIDWLQLHCTLPFKSVAFADITGTEFTEQIEQLSKRGSVVGIRYILDEQAANIFDSKLTYQHFSLLEQLGWSFDAQLSINDDLAIEHLINIAKTFKTVKIIINHGGWSPLNNHKKHYQKWLTNLQKLFHCENIAIKLSGWEMNDRYWQLQQVESIVIDSIKAMGLNRVMLASNFPLCLFTKSYATIWDDYLSIPKVSTEQMQALFFVNAKFWYQL